MKRPNGSGTLPFRLPNGKWRAEVTLGWDPSGKRIRRTVTRSSRALCEDAMRDLLNARDAGVLASGPTVTLGAWLTHWLEDIAAPQLRPSTVEGYRSKINTWITGTRLEKVRLDKLTPEHLDALYARMRAAGRAGSTVQMHRILARSLKIAVRRGRLAVSPCERMDSPQPKPFETTPLSMDDARRLIAAAGNDPHGVGWMIALALGPRQGERLGLGWDAIDLSTGVFTVKRTLERRPYRHGCGGTCGHRRGVDCAAPVEGGLFFGSPKSRAGSRTNAIPAPLLVALREHQARQVAARADDWAPYTDPAGVGVDLVFADIHGRPVHPRTDYTRWQDFLAASGVPPMRVHDARHTAATTLLVLGQDPRVVMELMGWSQVSMLARYQHVLDDLRRDAAAAVGFALWGTTDSTPPPVGPGAEVVSIDRARRARMG